MGISSRIRYKKIENKAETSQEYGCASSVQHLHGIIDNYTYEERRATENHHEWYRFLIEMGMPLEVTKHKGRVDVTINDTNYIKSKKHMLWIHSLIRVPSQEDYSFKAWRKRVIDFRQNPLLRSFDNYQIMQIATIYDSNISDDSPMYSQIVFGRERKEGLMMVKIQTMAETIEKFEYYSSYLNLNSLSSTMMTIEEFREITKKVLGKQYDSFHTIINKGLKSTDVDKKLKRIIEHLELLKNEIRPEFVIITEIGSKDALIKGNRYKIQGISKNLKLVEINDAFGELVKTRKFKFV